MKLKNLLITTLLMLFVSIANAATVSTSFTAIGAGEPLRVNDKDKFSYAVSGTFDANVELQQSLDGGQSYQSIKSLAVPTTGQIAVVTPNGQPALFRFYCRDFTSGTADTSLVDVDIVVQEFTDKNGKVLAQITEGGVVLPDNLETGGLEVASDDPIELSGDGIDVTVGGSGSALDTFWTTNIPGLIIDGSGSAAVAAFGAGLIYLGTDDAPMLIATEDRVDGLSTASIYMSTGHSTVIEGRTGDFDLTTGSTDDAGTQSGNHVETTGQNPSGSTGFRRIRTGNGADSGVIEIETGTGTTTRGNILLSAAGVKILTAGAKPACAVGIRGYLWNTLGGVGVADTLEVCKKDAANAYAWTALY